MSIEEELEIQLDSFDPGTRRDALAMLSKLHGGICAPVGTNINMHCHSFFSYNALGYSPSRIAWETRKAGLYAAALCDFDVLDGLEEFLNAGVATGQRAAASLETRAYFSEYAGGDISSPGEPGITYIMGAGFFRVPDPGTPQEEGLAGYRERARSRNEALIERINDRLPEVAIDYEEDVLPLTPAHGATERHIVSAYIRKARDVFVHPNADAVFWSDLLGISFEETVGLLVDLPRMEEQVRAKLVKRGGIGYEQPSPGSFPTVEDFVGWVLSCEAIPMVTWLDGTSPGENDGHAMLECMQSKGAAAVNIIPDRNWNIADPEARALKTRKLGEIVAAAEALDLPVNIGTEMNKLGLPFVDDLAGEVLQAYRETFLRGARIIVGHTILARYAGFSYVGDNAQRAFKDVPAKNEFFEAVGGMAPLDEAGEKELQDLGEEKALVRLFDAARPA
ncbi:MAG: hypothetical protein HQ559_00410 [Lentisphaerae bacterium]|nr:hypothetical protein [Lentisphaerota bacterium]